MVENVVGPARLAPEGPIAPISWGFVEILAVPSAERPKRCVTEHMGNVSQAMAAVREMARHFADAHPVENPAEACAFVDEPALEGSDIDAERIGDRFDRRSPSRHQDQDGLLDLLDDGS